MGQYQSANLSTGVFAERPARRIGWVLIVVLAALTTFAFVGRQHRAQLETVEQVTAVGDTTYFKMPEMTEKPSALAVSFQGKQLYPASFKRMGNRDSRMLRVGTDDSGAYGIYAVREAIDARKKEAEELYLKLGPDEYLNVRSEALQITR